MKSLSSKTYQCGVTIQGLTTLSGTVYLTGITNTASWDHVIVGTTAQGQIYTRTYAQFMGDVATGISLSSYVTGSGTTNYLPKFTGGSALGNSQIFDNGTNVGIGTASPVYKLDVNGIGNFSNGFSNPSSETGYRLKFYDNGGTYNDTGIGLDGSGGGGEIMWFNALGGFYWGLGTGGTKMKLDSSGNLGIGTTSPSQKLDVQGDISVGVSGATTVHTYYNSTTRNQIVYTNNSSFEFHEGANEKVRIAAGGNIGIGTTSPQERLDVNTNSTGLNVDNTAAIFGNDVGTSQSRDTWIKLRASVATTDLTWAFGANQSGDFRFNYLGTRATAPTSGTTLVTIKNSGNVGIGTSSPSRLFDVSAVNPQMTLKSTTTTGFSEYYFSDSAGDPGYLSYAHNGDYLAIGVNSAERMRITSGGNVVINSTSTPYVDDKLYIASGNIILDNNRGYLQYTTGGARATLLALNSSNNLSVGQSNANNASLLLYGGTGNVTVNAGAIEVARFTTAGNVGIGTTTPVGILHLYKSAAATRLAIDGDAGQNRLISYRTGALQRFGLYVNNTAESGANAGSNFAIRAYNDAGTLLSTPFFINRASGNIGIGTTSPSRALNIVSNNAQIRISDNTAPTTNYWEFSSVFFNTNQDLFISNQSGTAITLNASLNVGIGTTSPSYKLDVNGSFNALTSGVYLTYNSGIIYHGSSYYQFPSGSYYYLYGRTGMGLIFGSNNAEVGRFDLSGNLGIGTTSPGYKLEVNGIIKSGIAGNSSANYAALVVASAGTTTSQAAIAIQQLTSEGDTIIFGDYEPYVEYNFMHENASNVFHIHSGENTNSLGSNTFYNRSGNPRTGYIKWSLYQGNGDMHVGGSVGIGNTSPSTKLDVSGVITATGGNSTNWNTAYGWGNHASASYVPQARTLTINGTSYDLSANRSWTIATTTPGGSDTQVQYNSSGSLAGASALTYNSTTNRVGINQASPGYDLDVNGQVRVQDKLRVGTGNGVVHMSSTATINPSATTVVWAQTVSVGMCAFIEYYILNNNSLTDQRAGTIMVTWNQSGTPTIAHTETTTPDIGSTTTVNFTSSLVGSDARINAVNSSANPYTMVMSFKYF